ncbi:hypothetical protein SAMN05428974_1846 [Sphingopyxis sp. YR583]|uniref:hypothetical protein n=1 Tax=Sphingopyxis sp. YR583 TaxID=1881047 RepID=UPI0008A7D23C|nr:hypothetical protein [Sphingopyxis sp. YR583]SEH16725.1 hypothetical protein SAMN05428974_1846 [Sphingopyxis sp. YR583]
MRTNFAIRLAAALAPATILFAAGTANAATCEEAFVKKGNAITGLRFTAAVTVADLPPAVAIGQMRGLVAAKGYDIMADEAEYGSMLIEQPMTGGARAFPIQITATQTGGIGTVVMEAKLRAGQTVGSDPAKAEMCGILNQIQGGKAGAAAAKKGAVATTVAAAPVKISALGFSQQVSKDTERNAAGVLTRYKGKQFTIDGSVEYVTKDGKDFRVGYKVPNPWEQAIRLPNQAPFKTDIVCYMAPGQAAYSLQLKPDKGIKLTGTIEDFDEYKHIIWLKDCRPAQ